MKKVVIAIDSFKGSISSLEAGQAARRGVMKAFGEATDIVVKPLADGGEGTMETLIEYLRGDIISLEISDAIGEKRIGRYGVVPSKGIAIIEMAEAAGLPLVPKQKRDPMHTTTYGVGEMILDAIQRGYRQFIMGIGGSATNECGIGMLSALGFRFLDCIGREVDPTGSGVGTVERIDASYVSKEIEQCYFQIACDVDNPLCGTNGASFIYGPQKGADSKMVQKLDDALGRFADCVKAKFGIDYREMPGSGAAGGLGFGCMSFLNARLRSGSEIVMEILELEKDLEDAQYFITGEGCIDAQTAMGKGPIAAAKLARSKGAVVVGFAGAIGKDADSCNQQGMDAYFSITPGVIPLKDALNIRNAIENMEMCVEQVFRIIR